MLFAVLLLSVSSVAVKVTAQDNGSSSEKSSTAAKTCSPEQFKEQPGFCAAIAKESAASANKTGTAANGSRSPEPLPHVGRG